MTVSNSARTRKGLMTVAVKKDSLLQRMEGTVQVIRHIHGNCLCTDC